MALAESIRNFISGDRPPTSPPSDQPVREALHVKLREIRGHNERRAKLAQSLGAQRRDIDTRDALRARLDDQESERDRLAALAEYLGETPADSTSLDEDIRQLRQELISLEARAHAAELIQPTLQAEVDALTATLVDLHTQSNELLLAAAEEELALTAPDWLETAAAFRSAQRRTFTALVAMQKIAAMMGRPRNLGAAAYSETNLPKPRHAAFGFVDYGVDDFARAKALSEEHAVFKADVIGIDIAADELLAEMLRMESSRP